MGMKLQTPWWEQNNNCFGLRPSDSDSNRTSSNKRKRKLQPHMLSWSFSLSSSSSSSSSSHTHSLLHTLLHPCVCQPTLSVNQPEWLSLSWPHTHTSCLSVILSFTSYTHIILHRQTFTHSRSLVTTQQHSVFSSGLSCIHYTLVQDIYIWCVNACDQIFF